MKALIKKILQVSLGFQNYLFVFSLFIIYTLRWNRREGDFLYFLRMIPDGGTVIDIGANIGIMTVHFARKLKNSDVLAFEPVPQNIKALKRVIRFFRLTNVKIYETALGDGNGEIKMVMPVIRSVKMQGLSHVVNNSIPAEKEGEVFTAPVHKLDYYAELQKDTAAVKGIKIDVENYEYNVLLGGHKVIEKHRPVVYCELWDTEKREKCFELMKNAGYEVKVLEKKNLTGFDPGRHKTQNFFFVPLSSIST